MKFDELDQKMRVYETAHDYCVPPEVYLVARIDGRSFTRLTKEIHKFEAPFDERFRDYMVATTKHLMLCGAKVIYGYTQSDEISLLLSKDETLFTRKVRKLNSILAGEASAKFSLLLGDTACFDCRISELPNLDLVIDYFRWRNEDAHRNALNGHCYWLMRKQGVSKTEATTFLSGKSVPFKNEFLFDHGINFNEVANWQKRGIGLYWENYQKQYLDQNHQQSTCLRKRIYVDDHLPMKDSYSEYIRNLMIKTRS